MVDEQQRVSDKWVAWAFLFKGWLLQGSQVEKKSVNLTPWAGILVLGVQRRTAARPAHGQGIPSPISACESSLGSNGRPVHGPKTGDRPGGDGWDWVSWCNARPSSEQAMGTVCFLPGGGTSIVMAMVDLKMGPIPHREPSRLPGLVLLSNIT